MPENIRQMKLVVNRTEHKPRFIAGVYLITDQGHDLIERTRNALKGGVSMLQYRAKGKSHDVCLDECDILKKMCRCHGVTFLVNDDLHLAKEVDADGVHLGQDDSSVADARNFLGEEKIIGKSTHNLSEAIQAENDGADYIGFGAMYPTTSKKVTHIVGTVDLENIREKIRIPIVAIGGISVKNGCRVIDAGADSLAVISSVYDAQRPDIAVAELKLLFNRTGSFPRGAVMTVAGSDSGGGAGIQADIKTITLLGSYAASALTALTAQNTCGVSGIYGLPPSFVIEQMKTVLMDIPVDVIKTGMLHTPAIISALSGYLQELNSVVPLVIDPVMIAKGGANLMERDATAVFIEQFMPMAYLLTPNIPEAERILGRQIKHEADIEKAAYDIKQMGPANVLIKGGHMSGPQSCDTLFDGSEYRKFTSERIFTSATHGTGCSYASAIATFLAQGEPLHEAVSCAKEYITNAIRFAKPFGKGHGPVNHYLAAEQTTKGRLS